MIIQNLFEQNLSHNILNQFFSMGNSATTQFPSQSWTFDHRNDFYDIYRSSRGKYAEKHIVRNNPKIQPQDEMQVYNYRHKSDRPIVHVYDANYEKSDSKCGNQKNIEVYSEFIPHRLSDTRNLTHGQSLYVLSQALYGFEELHYRFGSFPITDDHIGFNQEGQTRVWHSPNFGSNHLPHDGLLLMSTKNPKHFDQRIEQKQEEQMVEDIWLAVDQHANVRRDFIERGNWFRNMNFKQARGFVADQIERTQDYVPQTLNFRDSHLYRGGYQDDHYSNNRGSRYDHRGSNYDDYRGSQVRGSQVGGSKFGTYRQSRVSPGYNESRRVDDYRSSRSPNSKYYANERQSQYGSHVREGTYNSQDSRRNIYEGENNFRSSQSPQYQSYQSGPYSAKGSYASQREYNNEYSHAAHYSGVRQGAQRGTQQDY